MIVQELEMTFQVPLATGTSESSILVRRGGDKFPGLE